MTGHKFTKVSFVAKEEFKLNWSKAHYEQGSLTFWLAQSVALFAMRYKKKLQQMLLSHSFIHLNLEYSIAKMRNLAVILPFQWNLSCPSPSSPQFIKILLQLWKKQIETWAAYFSKG